jgi:hypothetical protein
MQRARSDATNYLGGVGDARGEKTRCGDVPHSGSLATTAYVDDRRIHEGHHRWQPAACA